jgi:hypothetical protein
MLKTDSRPFPTPHINDVLVEQSIALPIGQMPDRVPSGKRLHNSGKSPFLMGKSTITVPCSKVMLVYQRVPFD